MADGNTAARFLPASSGLKGAIWVPGDKSISHRAVLLGAVNEGPVAIRGFLRSADTMATVRAVRSLGVRVEDHSEPDPGADVPEGAGGDADLVVHGCGWSGLSEPEDVIDVANSGTLIRLLPGILASLPFFTVLTGDASIRRRPMARILHPLAEMGAAVSGRCNNSLPPIAVRGGNLKGITHEMSVASAQVKSCVLLAGLRASEPTTVIEPAASRDHTERMIRSGGGRVERVALPDGRGAVTIWPVDELRVKRMEVPGDFSSAAFFLVAAILTPGSEISIHGVGLNPSRTALLDVLRRMGADVEVTPSDMAGPEPIGRITARYSQLKATDVTGDEVPNLIDELPLFLLASARAEGTSRLRGAAELRAKESDRLRVMAAILSTLGSDVADLPDGMDVKGSSLLWAGGRVDACGDHRMAMVGAIAGLISRSGVQVEDTGCIGVSFPTFMETMRLVGGDWREAVQ